MRKVTVRYQVATYSGTVDVFAGDDASDDQVIETAKSTLWRQAGVAAARISVLQDRK